MTLRTRKPGQVYRPMSEAQQVANERAFMIFRLRGLHAQATMLKSPRREQAQALVDEELALLGAETEAERCAEFSRTQAVYTEAFSMSTAQRYIKLPLPTSEES